MRTHAVPTKGLAFFTHFYPALTCWANECRRLATGICCALHRFARDSVPQPLSRSALAYDGNGPSTWYVFMLLPTDAGERAI